MRDSVLILCFCIIFPVGVLARPVSYPGGWTAITDHDGDQNNLLLHYTLTTNTSIGYRIAYDRETNATFNGVQMNNLLQRWNNPDSQANIYLKSAIGISKGDAEGFTGLQADWETRRYMVMYENMAMISPQEDRNEFHQNLGLGIAPYVADFGALHTWTMLHIMHEPESDNKLQLQPMLRFFKGPVLFEAGYNITNHAPAANAMVRF